MDKFFINKSEATPVAGTGCDVFAAASAELERQTQITKWNNATENNGDKILPKLFCRPEVSPEQDAFTFQVVDIQSYRHGQDDPIIVLFGTTEEGNSICVRVSSFEPYVDCMVPDVIQDDDFLTTLCDTIQGNVHGKYKTMRRLFGYVPDASGQPKKYKWARLYFEKDSDRRRFIKQLTSRDTRDRFREKIRRRLKCDIPSDAFGLAAEKMNMVNLFTTSTGIVPSGWARVAGENQISPNKPFAFVISTCQIEIESITLEAIPEKSDIAPLVTISFDLECIGPRDSFPKSHNPCDMVTTAGMSIHVVGKGILHRAVICLGDTDPVKNGDADIHVITCTNEIELFNQFRNILHHPRIDCDILTGFNIFGFDFKYFGDRSKRFEVFRQYAETDAIVDDASFFASSLAEHWRTAKRVVKRYKTLEKQWYKERNPKKRDPAIQKEVVALLEPTKEWSEYSAPWGNRFPSPSHKLKLLASCHDETTLMMNYLYYNTPDLPNLQFLKCSRIRTESCVSKEISVESAAMGSQCQYRLDMTGRACLDLYFHIKKSEKMGSYSLKNISQKFLGDTKVDLPYDVMFRHYRTGKAGLRAEIALYCSVDCDLPLRLMDKMGTIVDLIEMSRVSFTPLPAIITRGQQVKVFNQIAWWAEAWGFAANYVKIPAPDSYQGATVLPPEPGYHTEPISTLDFASLYPSIMQSHNLCYSTYVEDKYKSRVADLERKGLLQVERTVASGVEHWFVTKRTFHGVLPRLLYYLLTARRKVKKQMKTEADKYKKQMMDSKQLALKISCNSVYGFTGVAEKGMLGCWPIAA